MYKRSLTWTLLNFFPHFGQGFGNFRHCRRIQRIKVRRLEDSTVRSIDLRESFCRIFISGSMERLHLQVFEYSVFIRIHGHQMVQFLNKPHFGPTVKVKTFTGIVVSRVD